MDERGWTEKERRNFHTAFMAFGPGRWKEIQRKADLGHKDLDELREYAQEFIKQCIIHAEEIDRPIFLECLESILYTDTDEIEVEMNPDFTKLIKRKVKHW